MVIHKTYIPRHILHFQEVLDDEQQLTDLPISSASLSRLTGSCSVDSKTGCCSVFVDV